MKSQTLVLAGGLFVTTFVAAVAAQAPRPANVPFYTWVREDTFAGLIDGDFTRLEQGERKAQDYLLENPQRNDAANWLGATRRWTKPSAAPRTTSDSARRPGAH
jgi:hypothetical protein